jgi:hypothetical protein
MGTGFEFPPARAPENTTLTSAEIRSLSPFFQRRGFHLLAPFVLLAILAAWTVFATGDSFRLNDGSFSLHAPFWRTFPGSCFALFWFWGLLALVALLAWRPSREDWKLIGLALAWAAIGLLPYMFLTYSNRIPSRQTYLASAGVALLVGLAFTKLMHRPRPLLVAALVVLVAHNVGYLWTRKRVQFLKRAEPTEQLIEMSRVTRGPIYVKCFPRPRPVAEQAVWLVTGRPPSLLVWDPRDAPHAAATFCYQEHR